MNPGPPRWRPPEPGGKTVIRTLRTVAALAAVALMAGCSSMSVNYDFDSNADFAQYRTFAWMAKPQGLPADANQAKLHNDIIDRRIETAIQGELAARHIERVDENPGLLVVFHVGVEDKIQVTDYGYNYSPYSAYWGYGYGGRQLDVYQYQQGTLIIDLVDAKTKNLVWRGTGTKVLSGKQMSPDELQARINDVVAKIMQSYPPK